MVLVLQSSAVEPVSQHKLDWYEEWVTEYPNDAPPEDFILDPVELKKVQAQERLKEERRRERIRQDPEILPYLKALFWRLHRHPKNNGAGGVQSILEAMTLRPELKEEDVADITAEVDRILLMPFSGNPADRDNYLPPVWAQEIARRFPTKSNIERCCRIITRSDSIDWYFPKMMMLKVLTEIGGDTEKPLAVATQEWIEAKAVGSLEGGYPHRNAIDAKKQVEAMCARLEKLRSPDADEKPTSAQIEPSRIQSTPVEEMPSTIWHPLWFAAVLLILPVLLHLLRKKRNS